MNTTKKMKPVTTTLLAFALGIVALILWPKTTKAVDSVIANQTRSEKKGRMIDGLTIDRSSVRPKKVRPNNTPRIETEITKSIGHTDLDAWLESKRGNTRSYAEALVISGLLTKDPDLIRQGIQTDPKNGHLLFIGATLAEFSDEERLAMSKRFLAADPDNALSAFLCAANLSKAGEMDAAIQLIKGTASKSKMDNFRMNTQLMTDEALIAVGLSPAAAKIRSAYDMRIGYISDLNSLVKTLRNQESSLSTEDASELRSMTALMGQRLHTEPKFGTIVDHLLGLKLEEETLKGLPNDTPSPFEGLTIGEARESIAAERQMIKDALMNMPDMEDMILNNPDLAVRYIENSRLMGELEATKWLTNQTDSGR